MQKRVHKSVTRAVALTAAFALTVSGLTVHTSAKAAAKKAPTLSVSSITLKKGQSKKIKINANKQKIKKVTWKVDKTKLKITKKTKKYVIVKALKKGSASISVTIKTKEKTYTKKIKAQIKKAQKTTAKPKTTKKPVPTKVPGTKAPDASSAPDGPQTSDIPSVSVPPAETAATPTEVPLDTPKPDETKTPDETKAPTVTTPPSNPGYIPPAALEQNGMTLPNAWTNGNGTAARKLMELNPSLSGKRIKFSMELKFCGGSEPAESTNLNIVSNYNSYPTLKTFKMKQAWNKWETVTFIHRFKSFTNSDAIIYFDLPSEMTAYVRKITYTILDNGEPDELGGTPVSPGGWNKGQIYNLKKDSDAKFYENKQVNISFDVRVKGVGNPTGVCKVQSNYSASYPMLKTDIPLSKEWEHVDISYSFGTITDANPILYFSNEGDITDEMELYIKDVQVNISGAIATPTPRPPSETIDVDINKTVTLTGSQKGEWGGFVYAEFDSPVEIKSTDIVKAKIKVTHDGESTEQAYSMQVGLYTNGSDQFNSLCFTTTGFTSSQLKELVRKETPADKEDKNAVGFAIQNQNSLSTDKDVIVTLVKLQIERVKGSDTPSGTTAPGAPTVTPGAATATPAPTATPFESYELKGASQYQQIGLVTYTVGPDIPNAFHIEFTATKNAGVNLTISANGKECNYGCGTARTKDCDITVSQWGGNPIGSLSTGDTVTIKAVASGTNELDSFEFTEIIPSNDDGNLTAVDLTGIDPYVFAGTGGNFTMVMKTTKTIAPDITGKTLADYSKVVIECEESGSAQLTYSLMDKDDSGNTDAFVVYNQSPGTITINLNETNFNPPGTYQQKYADIDAAKALDVSNVCLKVTAPTAGYKGKIVIKSVTLVE